VDLAETGPHRRLARPPVALLVQRQGRAVVPDRVVVTAGPVVHVVNGKYVCATSITAVLAPTCTAHTDNGARFVATGPGMFNSFRFRSVSLGTYVSVDNVGGAKKLRASGATISDGAFLTWLTPAGAASS
jgi:hypothetical protein